MTKPNKDVKLFTRCTTEFAERIDECCEARGLVRPSDKKPVRSQWIEDAMETQMQIEDGGMELVDTRPQAAPVHPFATDPRCRGEPSEQPAPRRAAAARSAPEPPVGAPGVFRL